MSERVIHELNAMGLRKHRHVYRYFILCFFCFDYCVSEFVSRVSVHSYWIRIERHRLFSPVYTINTHSIGSIASVYVCMRGVNGNEKEMREKRKRSNKINITLSKSIIVSINSHTLLFTFASCCCCCCSGGLRKQRKPVLAQAKPINVCISHKIYRPIVYAVAASKACDCFSATHETTHTK